MFFLILGLTREYRYVFCGDVQKSIRIKISDAMLTSWKGVIPKRLPSITGRVEIPITVL